MPAAGAITCCKDQCRRPRATIRFTETRPSVGPRTADVENVEPKGIKFRRPFRLKEATRFSAIRTLLRRRQAGLVSCSHGDNGSNLATQLKQAGLPRPEQCCQNGCRPPQLFFVDRRTGVEGLIFNDGTQGGNSPSGKAFAAPRLT